MYGLAKNYKRMALQKPVELIVSYTGKKEEEEEEEEDIIINLKIKIVINMF